MKAYEKLLLIEQSQNDADFVLNEKKSYKHISKVFRIWTVQFSLYVGLFYILDRLNGYFALYNITYYYPIYNIFKALLSVILLMSLWKSLNKQSSLIERRFLKMWFIFPACIYIEQILICVFTYLNAEFVLSYYLSFPLSTFINIIMLFYIYSYFKNKNLLLIIILNIGYMLFSFLYSVYFPTIVDFTQFQIFLFSMIDNIDTYFITNILSMLFVLLLIGGEEDEKCI